MIVVYHNNKCIIRVESILGKTILFDRKKTIAYGLMQLAIQFPEDTLVWCHEDFQQQINLNAISGVLHHQKMMLSYDPSESNYLGTEIGYVEESPFINVNKKGTYPTWQMSSLVGVVYASVLLAFKDEITLGANFNYYLNSIAKVGMPLGLLCYSEPKLLIETPRTVASKASVFTLFKFVKQHYKTRWLVLLLLNLLMYEFRFPLIAFLFALIFKNRNKLSISLEGIVVQSNRKRAQQATIDVIIPTIGRKKYLYDVLLDLSKQTQLPLNVIIVEQNPLSDSVSELGFLTNQTWPFNIKHVFTHQAGACSARNVALKQIKNKWVFFADDDIRIGRDFIKKTLENIEKFGVKAVSLCCLQEKEVPTFNTVFQWGSFGSGCSVVASDILKNCSFNLGYEFGYGEDSDFGMQLRNQGNDVLFLPEPSILHLKAPVGGFRTKPILKWHDQLIQPKPSPTVMLYLITHNTKQQILGYKTILFFKYYKHQKSRNPFQYFTVFNKQWKQSIYWANQLKIDS